MRVSNRSYSLFRHRKMEVVISCNLIRSYVCGSGKRVCEWCCQFSLVRLRDRYSGVRKKIGKSLGKYESNFSYRSNRWKAPIATSVFQISISTDSKLFYVRHYRVWKWCKSNVTLAIFHMLFVFGTIVILLYEFVRCFDVEFVVMIWPTDSDDD